MCACVRACVSFVHVLCFLCLWASAWAWACEARAFGLAARKRAAHAGAPCAGETETETAREKERGGGEGARGRIDGSLRNTRPAECRCGGRTARRGGGAGIPRPGRARQSSRPAAACPGPCRAAPCRSWSAGGGVFPASAPAVSGRRPSRRMRAGPDKPPGATRIRPTQPPSG